MAYERMEAVEQILIRVANDLAYSKYAIALTGAGVSTESGVSDYRGPSGIWTKNPEAERMAYCSYERFLESPKGWWEEKLANPSLLGETVKVAPNPGHDALVELGEMGILRCVITQNIDGLHEKAGTKSLIEYHGSMLKLRCTACGSRFSQDKFDLGKLKQENQLPPHCPNCQGIVKTDTVAFGEPIPSDVAQQSLEEVGKCDLMLICGTSAVVYPFANLPRVAKERGTVTIIELNAEPTPLTEEGISDYLIQGRTGAILPEIVAKVKKIRK
ncbi:NAD-dependent deacetylase [Chloroflexota bacterium]